MKTVYSVLAVKVVLVLQSAVVLFMHMVVKFGHIISLKATALCLRLRFLFAARKVNNGSIEKLVFT